jgi:hypothetical protein
MLPPEISDIFSSKVMPAMERSILTSIEAADSLLFCPGAVRFAATLNKSKAPTGILHVRRAFSGLLGERYIAKVCE